MSAGEARHAPIPENPSSSTQRTMFVTIPLPLHMVQTTSVSFVVGRSSTLVLSNDVSLPFKIEGIPDPFLFWSACTAPVSFLAPRVGNHSSFN